MITCLQCSEPFIPKRIDGKYCSSKCGNRARTVRYTARQPAETRAQWRKYFYTERGTVTALLSNASDRAKKYDLPYDLDREWLTERLRPMTCEMSGLLLERTPRKEYRTNPFAPSLDRIVPRLGYVKTNTRVIAFIVNTGRSEFGDEILMQMARALVTARPYKGIVL